MPVLVFAWVFCWGWGLSGLWVLVFLCLIVDGLFSGVLVVAGFAALL